MKMLTQAVVIAALSAGLGLAYNGLSASGIPLRTPELVDRETAVQWSLHLEGLRAGLEEAKQDFDEGALFLDARSDAAYEKGHIPGAHLVPVTLYKTLAPGLLADVRKDRRIVAYCSGGSCQSSTQLARLLVEDGYTNVRCFYRGWPAWVEAGFPVRAGDEP